MPSTLRTDRLLLRQWRSADRRPFAALNADPEVMRYFPAPLTRRQSDEFVDRLVAHFARHGFGLWAVEVAGSGDFVGFTGLNVVPFQAAFTPAVEVGWRLARPAWGQGFASEAGRACLSHAFGTHGLSRVVSFTASVNTRSQAVMRRIGMQPAGRFDHPRLAPGHPLREHLLYEAGAATWPAADA